MSQQNHAAPRLGEANTHGDGLSSLIEKLVRQPCSAEDGMHHPQEMKRHAVAAHEQNGKRRRVSDSN